MHDINPVLALVILAISNIGVFIFVTLQYKTELYGSQTKKQAVIAENLDLHKENMDLTLRRQECVYWLPLNKNVTLETGIYIVWITTKYPARQIDHYKNGAWLNNSIEDISHYARIPTLDEQAKNLGKHYIQ